jgi:hypothetical protein
LKLSITKNLKASNKNLLKFHVASVKTRKHRTAEMTWGETATRKLKFDGQANKVDARALTSIELLGGAIIYVAPLCVRIILW